MLLILSKNENADNERVDHWKKIPSRAFLVVLEEKHF